MNCLERAQPAQQSDLSGVVKIVRGDASDHMGLRAGWLRYLGDHGAKLTVLAGEDPDIFFPGGFDLGSFFLLGPDKEIAAGQYERTAFITG